MMLTIECSSLRHRHACHEHLGFSLLILDFTGNVKAWTNNANSSCRIVASFCPSDDLDKYQVKTFPQHSMTDQLSEETIPL